MKKLLVGTAAVALGLSALAGPAAADGVSLDISGHMKGYVTWVDQDGSDATTDGAVVAGNDLGEDERSFDILRETEIHFSGETTLDNGLTVGIHIETDIDSSGDNGGDDFAMEEGYAYFSGAWGRVNFGAEDGAAYLLQVAAPSADSNSDGLRQYVSPVNYAVHNDTNANTTGILAGFAGSTLGGQLLRYDYDNAISGFNDKITYMTPVFNGFQGGVSYTPSIGTGALDFGVDTDESDGQYGDGLEIAARWEGMVGELGVALGAGYSTQDAEDEDLDDNGDNELDDRTAWNVGVDFDWGPFGFGVAYLEDDLGAEQDADQETWVIGADYTTGPFKIGVSYYNQDQELQGLGDIDDALGGAAGFDSTNQLTAANGTGEEIETERWTGGVVYTYGPGMTFRGSISHVEHEFGTALANDDLESTSVLLGTQINF